MGYLCGIPLLLYGLIDLFFPGQFSDRQLVDGMLIVIGGIALVLEL